ncbi:hypothetical protein BJ508DRAFT_361426 [Ascobolus immersus RN42]|uniref:Guanine nucleotide exchange factor n=1 Tax=Ascobolus immersus RN42 TaxID=1160509 RepID=A0A3N4IBK1_ASCIM|nr:hypothetical protein BJ508DRAFT_361426 [Ascobolus immersus RN42]
MPPKPFNPANALTGEAKATHLRKQLATLKEDLEKKNLSSDKRWEILEELKCYGRSPDNSDPIYEKEGITIISKYAFDVKDSNKEVSREALRIICNSLLLHEPLRSLYCDLGFLEKCPAKFKDCPTDDEFVLSRIMFLLTYCPQKATPIFQTLLEDTSLSTSIASALSRHATRIQKGKPATQWDSMALLETLKLIFNLTYHLPTATTHLTSCLPPLFTLLLRTSIPTPPLSPPLQQIINALLNFPLDTKLLKSSLPSETSSTEKLLDILDAALPKDDPPVKGSSTTSTTPTPSFDETASPLLSVLKNHLDTSTPSITTLLKLRLLPRPEDRALPLGKGNTLSARLLRTSAGANAPNTKDIILALLYSLSDSDPEAFVENVGYGYASGFLFSHNIPVPESITRAAGGASSGPSSPHLSPADAEKGKELRRTASRGSMKSRKLKGEVNPVTGQMLEEEERMYKGKDPFEGMTEEEKEREAERLFVLFERLRKTGIVDVENPVTVAQREGKLEDLGSDREDDSD